MSDRVNVIPVFVDFSERFFDIESSPGDSFGRSAEWTYDSGQK
jgi:hypothetical protein